jgi:hypothetical protein
MFMKNEFMVIKNKYTFIRVNICYSPLSCATPRSYRSHRIRLSLPVTPRIDPQNYYKLCYSLSVSLLGKRTQTMFKCSLKFPYTSIMLALCVRPSSSILNGGCYEGHNSYQRSFQESLVGNTVMRLSSIRAPGIGMHYGPKHDSQN